MLRKIRITLATVCFTLITLLFLDFTGTLHTGLGWLAKIQFLPALLALNFSIVAILVLFTLLLGRVYCSVICPLGVFQDGISWIAGRHKKYRFRYSPVIGWLRYGILGLFIVALIAGISSLVALLAPYSAYGRIAQHLFAPFWLWGNNLLACLAERAGSYAFYSVDVWMKGTATFVIAATTAVVIVLLAWRNGRTYCNTVCPVGTVLGSLSRFSLLKPVIDTSKCNACGLCARNCKASCINANTHRIDYSRCVACMNCIDKCRRGAVTYRSAYKRKQQAKKEAGGSTPVQNKANRVTAGQADDGRRSFLTATALLATASVLKAQEKKVDGGLAVILDKKIPARTTPLVPPGAQGIKNMAVHCTGCQLCVSVCPNHVLRPSGEWTTLTQPEMSYERGYCRPECTKCSEVCPAGAILPVTAADKSAIQIGHAVWIKENCVPVTDGVSCGNCARHCPTGAITMVPSEPGAAGSPKIPVVNAERCIGCGACENLCPSRPFSAIYVEGHQRHRTI